MINMCLENCMVGQAGQFHLSLLQNSKQSVTDAVDAGRDIAAELLHMHQSRGDGLEMDSTVIRTRGGRIYPNPEPIQWAYAISARRSTS
ncbi:hypothetical protein SRHO_G00227440 [Serrasalmus rhombeus]